MQWVRLRSLNKLSFICIHQTECLMPHCLIVAQFNCKQISKSIYIAKSMQRRKQPNGKCHSNSLEKHMSTTTWWIGGWQIADVSAGRTHRANRTCGVDVHRHQQRLNFSLCSAITGRNRLKINIIAIGFATRQSRMSVKGKNDHIPEKIEKNID